MTDNRIALSAAAAARLLLFTAGLFGGLTLTSTPVLAQLCQFSCDGGDGGGGSPPPPPTGDGGDQSSGDGGDGDGQTPDPDDGQTTDPDDGQTTDPDDGQTTDPDNDQGTNPGDDDGNGDNPPLPEPTPPAPPPTTLPISTPVTVSVTSPTVSLAEPFNGVIASYSSSLLVFEARPAADPMITQLPMNLASTAPLVRSLIETGIIDLVQLEAAVDLYQAFDSLDPTERQTLFEFILYGQNPLVAGLFPLMQILPPTDPIAVELARYQVDTIAARELTHDYNWAFKQAVALGYGGRIGKLAGLDEEFLKDLCMNSFSADPEKLSHCWEQVK